MRRWKVDGCVVLLTATAFHLGWAGDRAPRLWILPFDNPEADASVAYLEEAIPALLAVAKNKTGDPVEHAALAGYRSANGRGALHRESSHTAPKVWISSGQRGELQVAKKAWNVNAPGANVRRTVADRVGPMLYGSCSAMVNSMRHVKEAARPRRGIERWWTPSR